MSYFLVLATAGHETTSATLAAGVDGLARSPDQLRLLRENPSFIPGAGEEMLRWASSPIRYRLRG
jgi:cytochrome P450